MTDYISRDAFKQEVRRLSTHYLNEWDTLGVLAAVDRIPAADVRPVVRGRWETVMLDHERMGCRPTAHYCSECHQITWFRTFYCPNCGADMRSTDCTKTATADEEREVLNVRAWLNNGADMREES